MTQATLSGTSGASRIQYSKFVGRAGVADSIWLEQERISLSRVVTGHRSYIVLRAVRADTDSVACPIRDCITT